MFRRQPPVWSPLSASAILAGLSGRNDASVVGRLQDALVEEFGVDQTLPVSSGTVALTLALAGVRSDRPPLVALPAYGCYDLATAADGARASVVLYDLDPRTLAPDPDSLRAAAARRPDAVVVAHFFGVPVDLAWVRALVGTEPILVDDAAQGAGARFACRPLGVGGDVGVLSFGRGKGRTGGRGGALLGVTERGIALVRRAAGGLAAGPTEAVREVVALAGQWLLGRPGLYALPAAMPQLRLGETIYHPPPAPRCISTFAAAVAVANREANRREDAARREAGAWWMEHLVGRLGVEGVRIPTGAEPGWLRFPVVATGEALPVLSGSHARALGVMPGYPHPLAALPGFRDRVVADLDGDRPGAAQLASRLYTLPTHSRLTLGERRTLLRMIEAVG